jgi:hypothetical protein
MAGRIVCAKATDVTCCVVRATHIAGGVVCAAAATRCVIGTGGARAVTRRAAARSATAAA